MGNSLCHSKDIDISDRNIVVAKASEKKEEVPKQEQQTSSNINATNDGKLSSKIEKVSHSSSFFLSSPDSPSISSNPSPTTVVEDNNTTNSNNVDHSNQNQQTPSIQSSGKSIVFSQSPTEGDKKNSLLNNLVSNNNKNLYQTIATGTTASSDIDTPSYSLEKMDEQTQVSVDYQWLEGRRYHNTPGASYLLPNDIDEVDRLQLQHFVLRYAIKGNYKSPLDKSKVRNILDSGCGPGTWTMEMANEFPDANIVGVDMSPVFPSTIIPSNCRFVRQDINQGLPFPDNYFDFVHQRLLVAGLTPENWVNVIKELERVTKPGGWIELAEVDGKGDSAGPCTSKIWDWIDKALLTRGVDVFIGKDERLKRMVEEANIVNVNQYVIPLPTGEHGGKVGKLLLDNALSFYSAVTPIVIHGAGVDKEEYEEAVRISQKEVEEYKSYHVFFIITGQKRGSVETENNTI